MRDQPLSVCNFVQTHADAVFSLLSFRAPSMSPFAPTPGTGPQLITPVGVLTFLWQLNDGNAHVGSIYVRSSMGVQGRFRISMAGLPVGMTFVQVETSSHGEWVGTTRSNVSDMRSDAIPRR
jgi:hypothetical protein